MGVTTTDRVAAPQRAGASLSRLFGSGQPLVPVAVVIVYFCLGLIAFWPLLSGAGHQELSGVGDYALSTWFLGWVPHALVHGMNPFFSNAMFVPDGVNLAQNTEAPLLGLVGLPITLMVGPVATANAWLVLAMPLSATAAFIVLRRWQIWIPAAAIGGLVYGFSPYMIGQASAHPVLVFVPLPPFIVAMLVSILRRNGSDVRLGLALGLLSAAQYLISPEVFASLALIVAIGLAFLAATHPSRALPVARAVVRPIGIALVVAGILLAYPVWMLLAGPQHVSGATFPLLNPYHNDLLSFVDHGPFQRLSLGTPMVSTRAFTVDPIEADGYVGIPVLMLLALLAWKSRRSGRIQLACALLVSSAVLSLGPFLHVGRRSTSIPVPFWLIGHLPLMENLLPGRLSFEVGACLAAIVAFGLDDLQRARARPRRKVVGRERELRVVPSLMAGVTLAVLIVTLLPRWPYPTPGTQLPYGLSPISLPTRITRSIPPGDPVAITYPYAAASIVTVPLVWQAEDDYGFRLLGGYAFHPGPGGKGSENPGPLKPDGLQAYLVYKEYFFPRLTPPPGLVDTTRSTISRYHVRVIIVDDAEPGGNDVLALFEHSVGPPTVAAGNFTLWRLPHGKAANGS